MARNFPPDLLSQAQNVRTVWLNINQSLTFGEASPANLGSEVEAARVLDQHIALLESDLVDKRNERERIYASIWDKIKRARAGIKAIYGDDSSQYEMIGGTRVSERKRPERKAASA